VERLSSNSGTGMTNAQGYTTKPAPCNCLYTWTKRGLCWNVFILMADEVAGLRKPDMDPGFKKEVLTK